MPREQSVWFAMIDGREAGPMSRGEFALRMAADRVDEGTFVWKEGMSEWLPAADVRELAPMFHSRAKAKQRVVRPPPPPAAALAKAKPAAIVEEEIELELDLPVPEVPPPVASRALPPPPVASRALPPPPVPPEAPPPPVEAAPPPDQSDEDDWADRTVAEMLPLGERIHQEEVAQRLFDPSGEYSVKSNVKTGAFAIDEVKWAYARTATPPPPQDAKAAALARAIQATSARPSEPALPRSPVTPAYPSTPPAGLRPRPAPPKKPESAWSKLRAPRAAVLAAGLGIGMALVAATLVVLWLVR